MPSTPERRDVAARARTLLPGLLDDLVRLASIPSIATDGFPTGPLHEAHRLVVELLRRAGATSVEEMILPGMTTPTAIADVAGPEGAPTVLVYTHYDVVPEGDPTLWDRPAFETSVHDGAVHGRGVAD
ncbi:MAG TPA: M20/M25/M40 family metallo-hydrolase, partial [Actinotalea sp.]|nr:M20/M25/M40 family metallo-hydrolase [Actinotalea sp.]